MQEYTCQVEMKVNFQDGKRLFVPELGIIPEHKQVWPNPQTPPQKNYKNTEH